MPKCDKVREESHIINRFVVNVVRGISPYDC